MTLLGHRIRRAECLGLCLVVVMVMEPAWQGTRGWRAVQGARSQGPRLWRVALLWGHPMTRGYSSGMWVTMRWLKRRRRQ